MLKGVWGKLLKRPERSDGLCVPHVLIEKIKNKQRIIYIEEI